MTSSVSRRKFMAGLSAFSGIALTGCNKDDYVPPHFGGLLDASDTLTMTVQRMLLTEQTMAREYSVDKISKNFPIVGTRLPDDPDYQMSLKNDFADWRLVVDGLVKHPLSLSLADLRSLRSRTQVTSFSCERGWTAIGEWTGTPLCEILALAKMQPAARYVTFECADGAYDFLDLFDALHAQTILAYGMNGGDLPVQHGAPVRLRVERQLGYKSLKFVQRIHVSDVPDEIYDRKSELSSNWRLNWRLFHFSWYGGI